MTLISKPWGHEEHLFIGEQYVVKKLFVTAGNRLSRQYHREKHECLYVLGGNGSLELSQGEQSESHPLKESSFFVIPPERVHRIIADTDLTILETSTTQLDDVVRLTDDYGRAGQARHRQVR